ncbi:MAG: hypothetical protein J5U19_07315 [Candidatus Methanoperedens sp.]|nr:hypothetical protein [Candidatus Methanoperedens sp.]
MDEKFSDKVFATADQAVGHGGEKVPILGHLIWYSVTSSWGSPLSYQRREQAPRVEQLVLTESDVKVDETMGVLVISEPVLQAEADIETQAESDAQLDSNTHNPQRPVSVMNAPVEFTSESLLA